MTLYCRKPWQEKVQRIQSQNSKRRQVSESHMRFTGQQLQAYLYSGQSKRKLWDASLTGGVALSRPWSTSSGLLRTGRWSYKPMNQNFKSMVHHTGFLYMKEWFLGVWHQLSSWLWKHDSLFFFVAAFRVGNLHKLTVTLNQKCYYSILQHHALSSGLCLVCQGSSYSRIMVQNIPPGNARTTLEKKNIIVDFNNGMASTVSKIKPHCFSLSWGERKSKSKATNRCKTFIETSATVQGKTFWTRKFLQESL